MSTKRQTRHLLSTTKRHYETSNKNDILLLFDVDGTLTKARQLIKPEVDRCLDEVRLLATLGIVSGSDLTKISEQLGGKQKLEEKFLFVFAENGLVAFKEGKLLGCQNIVDHLGEEKIQKLINFSLRYLSGLKLPVKRGHFIDFRSGIINLCPVGRSCSQVSIRISNFRL